MSAFSQASPQYSQGNENRFRADAARRDGESLKRGRDIELAAGERLILRSPDGSRFYLSVADDGTLTAEAL
jgi:hypothetical protein